MVFQVLADTVLLLHLAFILFVAGGALLVWRWFPLAWLHLPAALWGFWIEMSGSICPLTSLENRLLQSAGEVGYRGGFIENYALSFIYPDGLTRQVEIWLGIAVLIINLSLYAALWTRASWPSRAR